MTLASLIAAAVTALPASTAGGASLVADSTIGPGREVPFVAQGPLLCGGAAAAMLERFWGARGVYAEDYAALVRPEEGGIRTDDLGAALQARGMRIHVTRDDASVASGALERGLPVLLLIASGAVRLHYVVLTELRGDTARFHDPNWGPDRTLPWPELRDAWARSGYWALLALGRDQTPEGPVGTEAIRLPDGSVEALREGRTDDARAAARALLEGPSPDAEAGWRLLATARWLDGDVEGALDAWNRVGEPRLDLVEAHGLERTRYHALAARSGLHPDRPLTSRALRLARRRVGALPSLAAVRAGVRMAADGSATVEVAAREHPPAPTSWTDLARVGLGALTNRSARLGFGPATGAAERWSVGGSWDPASLSADVGLRAPVSLGIVEVAGVWRRERYATSPGSPDTEEMRGASLGLEEWIAPGLALGARAGFQRWAARGATGSVAVHAMGASDRNDLWVRVDAEGWEGAGAPFGRLGLRAGAAFREAPDVTWRIETGVTGVSGATPRLLWPGAGSGRVRAPLLRAHGLVEGDRLTGPVFGRGLAWGNVERFRAWRLGPVRWGWVVFADVAGAWSRPEGSGNGPLLDTGVGVRLATGDRELDLTLAHGADGWRWNATTRTDPPWARRPGR